MPTVLYDCTVLVNLGRELKVLCSGFPLKTCANSFVIDDWIPESVQTGAVSGVSEPIVSWWDMVQGALEMAAMKNSFYRYAHTEFLFLTDGVAVLGSPPESLCAHQLISLLSFRSFWFVLESAGTDLPFGSICDWDALNFIASILKGTVLNCRDVLADPSLTPSNVSSLKGSPNLLSLDYLWLVWPQVIPFKEYTTAVSPSELISARLRTGFQFILSPTMPTNQSLLPPSAASGTSKKALQFVYPLDLHVVVLYRIRGSHQNTAQLRIDIRLLTTRIFNQYCNNRIAGRTDILASTAGLGPSKGFVGIWDRLQEFLKQLINHEECLSIISNYDRNGEICAISPVLNGTSLVACKNSAEISQSFRLYWSFMYERILQENRTWAWFDVETLSFVFNVQTASECAVKLDELHQLLNSVASFRYNEELIVLILSPGDDKRSPSVAMISVEQVTPWFISLKIFFRETNSIRRAEAMDRLRKQLQDPSGARYLCHNPLSQLMKDVISSSKHVSRLKLFVSQEKPWDFTHVKIPETAMSVFGSFRLQRLAEGFMPISIDDHRFFLYKEFGDSKTLAIYHARMDGLIIHTKLYLEPYSDMRSSEQDGICKSIQSIDSFFADRAVLLSNYSHEEGRSDACHVDLSLLLAGSEYCKIYMDALCSRITSESLDACTWEKMMSGHRSMSSSEILQQSYDISDPNLCFFSDAVAFEYHLCKEAHKEFDLVLKPDKNLCFEDGLQLNIPEFHCFAKSVDSNNALLLLLVPRLSYLSLRSVSSSCLYLFYCSSTFSPVDCMPKMLDCSDSSKSGHAFTDGFSDISVKKVDDIDDIIRKVHLKTEYYNLLCGRESINIEKLITGQMFQSNTFEIDFTLYMSLLSHVKDSRPDEVTNSHERLTGVLEYFMHKIPKQDFFYLTNSSERHIQYLITCSQYPLFMSLEYRMMKSGVENDYCRATVLPSTFKSMSETNLSETFNNSNTKGADEYGANNVSLKMVYYYPRNDVDTKQATADVINQFEKRFLWVMKEEIIHSLLYAMNEESVALKLVEKHLTTLTTGCSHTALFNIPVQMVRREVDPLIFETEFQNIQFDAYRVKKILDFYRVKNANEETPFWLFFKRHSHCIQVMFFAKYLQSQERETILAQLNSHVTSTLRRINQITLLRELNETRICSKYLIAPGTEAEDFENEEDNIFDAADKVTQVFEAGQFSCSLVGRWQFPLHWRFKPSQALNALVATTLHPLSVSNRRNFFVFAQNNAVFYLRIYEMTVDDGPDETANAKPDMKNEKQVSKDLSKKKTNDQNNMALILEGYGVDEPTLGLKADFVNLIGNRLSGLTLNLISSSLARNVNLKLSQQDVDFILPKDREANVVMKFDVPDFCSQRLFKLLAFFKQSMCQVFGTFAPVPELNARLNHIFHNHSQNQDSQNATPRIKINLHDFLCYYNSTQSRVSNPNDFFIGQGLASISISLFDRQSGAILLEIPNELDNSSKNMSVTSLDFLNDLESNASDYALHIQIWSEGSLQLDILCDFIKSRYKDSLFDLVIEHYLSESNLSSTATHLGTPEDIEVRALLDKLQTSILAPVQELTKSYMPHVSYFSTLTTQKLFLSIPSVVMSEFCSHAHTLLSTVNSHISPVFIQNVNGTATPFYPRMDTFDPDNVPVDMGTVLLISGIPGLIEVLQALKPKNDRRPSQLMPPTRKLSTSSDDDPGKLALKSPRNSSQNSPEELYLHNFVSTMLSSTDDKSVRIEYQRHCVVFLTINHDSIDALFYNFNRTFIEKVKTLLQNMTTWFGNRQNLLDVSVLRKSGFPVTLESKDLKLIPMCSSSSWSDYETIVEKTIDMQDVTIQDFYHAFLDGFIEQTPGTLSGFERPFSFHARQSLELARRSRDNSLKHAKQETITEKWQQHAGDNPHTFMMDLMGFLREARLFHWCRTPILFSPLREALFLPTGDNVFICTSSDLSRSQISRQFPDELAARNWFKSMTHSLITDYVSYLKTLGMQVIFSNIDNSPNDSTLVSSETMKLLKSKFTVTKTVSAETPVAYLQKTFQGGTLVIEVRFQDMFVSVNLYTAKQINVPTAVDAAAIGPSWSHSRNLNRQLFRLFTEECAKFKNLIHVNSFIYDFHLRYMGSVFCDEQLCVTWLDFVDILRSFLRFNITAAAYARNSIKQGFHEFKTQMTSREMFKYIARNPERFGVKLLNFGAKCTACYICSSRPDLLSFSIGNDLQYCLVIIANEEESTANSLSLEYIAFMVHRQNRFPFLFSSPQPSTKLSSVLQQIRSENNPFLPTTTSESLSNNSTASVSSGSVDISSQATGTAPLRQNTDLQGIANNRIQVLIEQTLRYFGRDFLWRQLVAAVKHSTATASSTFTFNDFMALATRYNSQSLLVLNKDLSSFLKNTSLPWLSIFEFLVKFYAGHSLEFTLPLMDQDIPYRHVILLNPCNQDLLVQITLNSKNEVGMNSVNRELRESVSVNPSEEAADNLTFVADIVRTVSFYIYKISKK